MKHTIRLKKRGNMPGLAKHLAKKLSGDPGFFTKCMADDELQGYDTDARAALCAKAHKLVTGIYPGEHGGDNPNGPEKKERSGCSGCSKVHASGKLIGKLAKKSQ